MSTELSFAYDIDDSETVLIVTSGYDAVDDTRSETIVRCLRTLQAENVLLAFGIFVLCMALLHQCLHRENRHVELSRVDRFEDRFEQRSGDDTVFKV